MLLLAFLTLLLLVLALFVLLLFALLLLALALFTLLLLQCDERVQDAEAAQPQHRVHGPQVGGAARLLCV